MGDSNYKNESAINSLSFKEVVFIFKDYVKYVFRNFLYIILGGILCASLMGAYAYFYKNEYIAKLTFVVDDSGNQNTFSLSNSIAALGIGGRGGKTANLERIIDLCKSDYLIHQALLSKMENSDELIANVFIDEYIKIEEDSKLTKLRPLPFDELNLKEKRTLRVIKKTIFDDAIGFNRAIYDEDTGIITMSSRSRNADLSFSYINEMYDRLSKFYRRQMIEKSKQNVASLEFRRDSIQQHLTKGEASLARMNDQSTNYLYISSSLEKYRKKREVEFNSQMYIDVVQNLELALYKLSTITPYFSTIDKPFMPLPVLGKPLIPNVIMGFAIGIILSILIVIGVRLYRTLMNDEEEVLA